MKKMALSGTLLFILFIDGIRVLESKRGLRTGHIRSVNWEHHNCLQYFGRET